MSDLMYAVPKFHTEEEARMFFRGLRAGITLFAYWADGVEHVGTCGNTLKPTLKKVDADERDVLIYLRAGAKP